MKKLFTQKCFLLGLSVISTGITFAQDEKNVALAECATAQEIAAGSSIASKGESKFNPQSAVLLFDNGPLINQPGMGSGGKDVSALHDGLNTFGYNQNSGTGIRLADDFTIPAGQTWTIDSVVTFGYQTNSGNVSTFTGLTLAVHNASPLTNANPSTIVWGDTTTNIIDHSYWSGIYRTTATTYTSTARPIMKIAANPIGLKLSPGQYWLDWSAAGSTASGPWNPPVTFPTQMITGDAIQRNGSWVSLIDTAAAGPSDNSAQGMPFLIYGTINVGVNELYTNNNVSLYPNPMTTNATVVISDVQTSAAGFSFRIYDLLGHLVSNTEGIKTTTFSISRNELSAGMYTYEVLNGKEILKRGKLSVQE